MRCALTHCTVHSFQAQRNPRHYALGYVTKTRVEKQERESFHCYVISDLGEHNHFVAI